VAGVLLLQGQQQLSNPAQNSTIAACKLMVNIKLAEPTVSS
jgi:hypothetical protein